MKKKDIIWKFENILKDFENIEKELLLDKSIIKGVPWWDMVRYPIFNKLVNSQLRQNNILKKKSIKIILSLFFQNLKNLILSFFIKSPFLIKKDKNIIWTNPRRIYKDGYYISPYVDEFIDLFPSQDDFAVLESTGINGHLSPPKTKNLLYAEKLIFLSYILSYFRIVKLKKKEISLLLKLEEKIFQTFSYKINMIDLVKKKIKSWLGTYPVMQFFFKIKKPKLFFVVASPGLEPIIAAAKSTGIKTLELQHGSPTRGKLNYDYSSGITKHSFPDCYLSFGNYWDKDNLLPIEKKNIISFGYPYLNKKVKELSNIKKENRLVVISQEDCSEELTKLAIEIKKYFHKTIIVEFKPHPASLNYENTQSFKNLQNAGVLISKKNDDLHMIFAKSRWQVGVYSTALYEGLCFDVTCFIYKNEKSKLMEDLIKKNLAKYISSPKDIDLNWVSEKKNLNEIFCQTSRDKIKKFYKF